MNNTTTNRICTVFQNGEGKRGEYTGYSELTKKHHVSLYNGDTIALSSLAGVKFDTVEPTKELFETGATSHAVNDLILFTDNTRELAELRDKSYKKMHSMNRQYNRPTDFNTLEIHYRHFFYDLMLTAMRDYKKTFQNKEDHKHIWPSKVDKYGEWTDKQSSEYCRLYLIDFENWKFDHGYK